MSRHLTVGIIGHVDHGKTSLVKALTGIDTDRLPEEKARGMSIALGFAWLELDNGTIDLIDVPGHENFVRTMIGGASGMGACLLVVDAREGIKPQTEEHLAIVQLMGIRKGIVALTKCESLPVSQRHRAVAAISECISNTSIEDPPVVLTSSVTGEGITELRHHLQRLLEAHIVAPPAGHFYLPIDRAFALPGWGAVVTGTLRSGCMALNDEVEILPLGLRSTVRRLENHGKDVDQATPGQRIGVNLRQVKAEQLSRGLVLASPGCMRTSILLNARLSLLKDAPHELRHGQRVRLLFGTNEVVAQVRLLSCDSLMPGEAAFAQLRTQKPVAAAAQMPFIIRSESPARTLGGGRILDPAAQRCRRGDPSVIEHLQRMASGTHIQVMQERLRQAGYTGLSINEIAVLVDQTTELTRSHLVSIDVTWLDESHIISTSHLDALCDMCIATLHEFHQKFPARRGAPFASCRAALPDSAGEQVFKCVLQRLQAAERIEIDEGTIRLCGFDPLSALEPAARRRVLCMEQAIRQGGTMPPDIEEVAKDKGGMDLLYLLVSRGDLIVLPGEHPGKRVAFHREAVDNAHRLMMEAFPPPCAFTVSEFRMLIGSTRKFTVPLLTYFDSIGVTRRNGDKRHLCNALHGGERSLVTSLVFKTSGPSHHG